MSYCNSYPCKTFFALFALISVSFFSGCASKSPIPSHQKSRKICIGYDKFGVCDEQVQDQLPANIQRDYAGYDLTRKINEYAADKCKNERMYYQKCIESIRDIFKNESGKSKQIDNTVVTANTSIQSSMEIIQNRLFIKINPKDFAKLSTNDFTGLCSVILNIKTINGKTLTYGFLNKSEDGITRLDICR